MLRAVCGTVSYRDCDMLSAVTLLGGQAWGCRLSCSDNVLSGWSELFGQFESCSLIIVVMD